MSRSVLFSGVLVMVMAVQSAAQVPLFGGFCKPAPGTGVDTTGNPSNPGALAGQAYIVYSVFNRFDTLVANVYFDKVAFNNDLPGPIVVKPANGDPSYTVPLETNEDVTDHFTALCGGNGNPFTIAARAPMPQLRTSR